MKKMYFAFFTLFLLASNITGCSAQTAENTPFTMTLQIDNPVMTVNGMEKEIDPGRETAPMIQNNRTLLPIRAVVEEMGGAVAWDEETQTAVLAKAENIILLSVGSTEAYFNEEKRSLDTPPVIWKDRTMLPIRFIAESFGFTAAWDSETSTVTITKEAKEG